MIFAFYTTYIFHCFILARTVSCNAGGTLKKELPNITPEPSDNNGKQQLFPPNEDPSVDGAGQHSSLTYICLPMFVCIPCKFVVRSMYIRPQKALCNLHRMVTDKFLVFSPPARWGATPRSSNLRKMGLEHARKTGICASQCCAVECKTFSGVQDL